MTQCNPQAEELNQILEKNNPALLKMLSNRGKRIFFPKKGIISQAGQAKGKKINATIGMALENDGTPLVLNSLQKLLNIQNAPEMFTYASSFGNPALRKLWKEKLITKNPVLKNKTISTPVITNALTHGLSMCGYLFLNENDTIIAPDLFWGNYRLIFSVNYQAEIETYKTFEGQNFNSAGFSDLIMNHPSEKLTILLNFPNNPSGYTLTEAEAKDIKACLLKAAESGKKLIVITDDAYFGLVYEEGIIKESLFGDLADMHSNILAVKIDGPTKEDYVWGFRVGFITFGIKHGNSEVYDALESKTGGAIRSNISNAPNISQSLLLEAYKNPNYENEKKEKYNTLKERYLKVKELFKNNQKYQEYFEAIPFNSGYFMCITLKKGNAENIRQILLEKYSAGVIAMGHNLRIAFSATPLSELETLFDSIYNACKEYQN